MAKATKSETQKRYMMRLITRDRAKSLGLTEVPTLASFTREDGLFVTVDANGNWHSYDRSLAEAFPDAEVPAPATPAPVVAPATKTATPAPEQNKEIDVKHAVRHWQKTVLKELKSNVSDGTINLTMHDTIDYPRKFINAYSRLFSRMDTILQGIKGPDWREQLGLDNLEDSE